MRLSFAQTVAEQRSQAGILSVREIHRAGKDSLLPETA